MPDTENRSIDPERIEAVAHAVHALCHGRSDVSLAAHVAAAVPNLDYACDTHYPWQEPDEEVIKGGKLPIVDGCVTITRAPGLSSGRSRSEIACRTSPIIKSLPATVRNPAAFIASAAAVASASASCGAFS